jgi:hypothetical protein
LLELGAGRRTIWGMLLGSRDDCFKVGTWWKGRLFISADLYHRSLGVKWT